MLTGLRERLKNKYRSIELIFDFLRFFEYSPFFTLETFSKTNFATGKSAGIDNFSDVDCVRSANSSFFSIAHIFGQLFFWGCWATSIYIACLFIVRIQKTFTLCDNFVCMLAK